MAGKGSYDLVKLILLLLSPTEFEIHMEYRPDFGSDHGIVISILIDLVNHAKKFLTSSIVLGGCNWVIFQFCGDLDQSWEHFS